MFYFLMKLDNVLRKTFHYLILFSGKLGKIIYFLVVFFVLGLWIINNYLPLMASPFYYHRIYYLVLSFPVWKKKNFKYYFKFIFNIYFYKF